MTYDNYRLIPLPLEGYDPDRMDFKLIINPLYMTAVWSDEEVVRAVAMDHGCRPVSRYEHRMSRSLVTPEQRVFEAIFPFRAVLEASGGGYPTLSLEPGGKLSLIGLGVCLALFLAGTWWRRRRLPKPGWIGLVALTGIYGLIAAGFLAREG